MLMEFLNLKQRSLFVIHNTPGFKLLTMPELRISPANICWSWKHLARSLEDVLKTSWRHVFKTSSRHYGDKQNTYWGYLYLTNLNMYLTNLYLTNLHLTILRRIQNALSRTHHFNICLILELKQHLCFKN